MKDIPLPPKLSILQVWETLEVAEGHASLENVTASVSGEYVW